MVTVPTYLEPGLIALHSCGWGGANGHLVLEKGNDKKIAVYKKPKHRLVLFSGRTFEAVNHGLDQIANIQEDNEFLALLDEIHKINISGHMYRGLVNKL